MNSSGEYLNNTASSTDDEQPVHVSISDAIRGIWMMIITIVAVASNYYCFATLKPKRKFFRFSMVVVLTISNVMFSLSGTFVEAVMSFVKIWKGGDFLCMRLKFCQFFSLHLSSMMTFYLLVKNFQKRVSSIIYIVSVCGLSILLAQYEVSLIHLIPAVLVMMC